MPDQRISYQVNPLPQAKVPQRPSKRAISPELPENLYKPPLSKTRQPFQPAAKPTRSNPVEPPQPASDPRRFQQPEAQTIAQHMRNDSDSARLEQLLRRQESRRYEQLQKPLLKLEQLSIVRRINGGYQIVLRFNQQAISRQVFRTSRHCAEAAAELEQRFELSIAMDGATAEAMEAIVRAAVARERVELECAVA